MKRALTRNLLEPQKHPAVPALSPPRRLQGALFQEPGRDSCSPYLNAQELHALNVRYVKAQQVFQSFRCIDAPGCQGFSALTDRDMARPAASLYRGLPPRKADLSFQDSG